MNGCVSFINSFKFREYIVVYQDKSEIHLAQSTLARSLVSGHGLLAISHALQVSLPVGARFCMLALIANIFVLAGQELM